MRTYTYCTIRIDESSRGVAKRKSEMQGVCPSLNTCWGLGRESRTSSRKMARKCFLQPYGCTTRLYEHRVPITDQFLNLAHTALCQFNIFKRLCLYALLYRCI